MRMLVFDPSGNSSAKEGFGTTGWAVFNDGKLVEFGEIASTDYKETEMYWSKHADLITKVNPSCILCESYKLFGHKAKQQSGSSLDTPQLIGYLRMCAWTLSIPFIFQDPKDKVRFNDEVLEDYGYIQVSRGPSGKITGYMCQGKRTSMHMRDAIRHGLFALKYNKELKKL